MCVLVYVCIVHTCVCMHVYLKLLEKCFITELPISPCLLFEKFCHHISLSNSDQPRGCHPLGSASSVAVIIVLHFPFSRKVLICLDPSVSSSVSGNNTVFPSIPSYKPHALSTFIPVSRQQQTPTPVWGLVGGISQGLTHCQALPLTCGPPSSCIGCQPRPVVEERGHGTSVAGEKGERKAPKGTYERSQLAGRLETPPCKGYVYRTEHV